MKFEFYAYGFALFVFFYLLFTFCSTTALKLSSKSVVSSERSSNKLSQYQCIGNLLRIRQIG